jgi:uncharacterized BrkB/YihY/UPF0761 family membrane protein
MEAEMHALSSNPPPSNNKAGTSEKQFREVISFVFYRLFDLLLVGFILLGSSSSVSLLSLPPSPSSKPQSSMMDLVMCFLFICVSSFFLHFVFVFLLFLVAPTHILTHSWS